MSIREILTNGGGVLVIVMTLVQIAPVKLNPWSAIGKLLKKAWRACGKAFSADVLHELSQVRQENAQLKESLEQVEDKPKTYQESILHGMVQELENGVTFLPSSHELKNADDQEKWWLRSPVLGRKRHKVVIVVEGGRVTEIYASEKDGIIADVIDTDTDDADREAEIREEIQELERAVAAGELYQIE